MFNKMHINIQQNAYKDAMTYDNNQGTNKQSINNNDHKGQRHCTIQGAAQKALLLAWPHDFHCGRRNIK